MTALNEALRRQRAVLITALLACTTGSVALVVLVMFFRWLGDC